MNLPEAFLRRMQERLGENFPAFLASYGRPPAKALRINTLKISASEFSRRSPFPLGEKIGDDPACVYIGEEKPGADPYHFAGLYYVQEPSAMAAGGLVRELFTADVMKTWRVLDLCAAPGGKTTHVAAGMGGKGVLLANEVDYKRARILKENVERMGIRNCAVSNARPELLAERLPEWFDLVLVDAPCSGEGMFKKEENAIPEWSEKRVLGCAARQRSILEAAARTVADRGYLMYSTCTFAEEEDEWQIASFLKEHPEFVLLKERKLYPHTFFGEGQYVALLRKIGGGRGERSFGTADMGGAKRVRALAEALVPLPEGSMTIDMGGSVFFAPGHMPLFSGIPVLCRGTEIGSWDGKNFKPGHGLAMAYGSGARRKLSLSREEAKKFLRGETLDKDLENGWCVVCVEEFPIGIGKCVNGTVKNHLPKSLRMIDRT